MKLGFKLMTYGSNIMLNTTYPIGNDTLNHLINILTNI